MKLSNTTKYFLIGVSVLVVGLFAFAGIRFCLMYSAMKKIQIEANNAKIMPIHVGNKFVYVLSWKKEMSGDGATYRVISTSTTPTESHLVDYICNKGFYDIYYRIDQDVLHIYSKDFFTTPLSFDKNIKIVIHDYGIAETRNELTHFIKNENVKRLPE